ncbi:probable methionine--tRNA ligase [Raphanus sativus]|uniref:Probable methionine--tRNA ligase n=1 Tax=Raphanus sativus TaxID=3726 RepID=A0A6J0N1G0_RAPSA|nr:probable methionine--tRNA ligase [Raphanus sativus]
MDSKTKQMIVSALCKHFSLDSASFVGGAGESDVKALYANVLKASGKEASAQNNGEVLKWLEYAEGLPASSKDCFAALEKLNAELAVKSVILGNGLTPSAADVVVFAALHSSALGLSDSDKEKIPHVVRWMNYIQIREGLSTLFGPISVKLPQFDFEVSKAVVKVDANANAKKTAESAKPVEKSEAQPSTKKTDVEEPKKKATKEKEAKKDKKKPAETEPAANKEVELSVSLLNIQVGLIRKAWKHPSADSLLVEEIDVGEGKVRQVVSGLAKFCSPDDLTNRLVALITNVKPGKLRDVMSEGLVLCASNEDHSVVEPLLPPAGAKPGERVSFSGVEGKPEDVLNPKKKQLEKITPHLYTDESGVATYKGIPFMTSAGPCTSSIPKATIK